MSVTKTLNVQFPARISATKVTSLGAVGELTLNPEQSTSMNILHSELLEKKLLELLESLQ